MGRKNFILQVLSTFYLKLHPIKSWFWSSFYNFCNMFFNQLLVSLVVLFNIMYFRYFFLGIHRFLIFWSLLYFRKSSSAFRNSFSISRIREIPTALNKWFGLVQVKHFYRWRKMPNISGARQWWHFDLCFSLNGCNSHCILDTSWKFRWMLCLSIEISFTLPYSARIASNAV